MKIRTSIKTGNPTQWQGITVRSNLNFYSQHGSDNALHLVSAFDTVEGLVLCQQSMKSKGGELAAARQLLDCLDIKGAFVTMDALHCQKDTLHKLAQNDADFVIQVKGNQPTLLAAVKAQFQPYWENNGNGLAQHHTQNHGHGRREERTAFQLVANLPEELTTLWPEVKSLIAVERSRCQQGKGTLDTQYYVSSLEIDAELAAKAVRQH